MSVNSMFCFPPSKGNDEHRTVAAISPFGDATHQRRQDLEKTNFKGQLFLRSTVCLNFMGATGQTFFTKFSLLLLFMWYLKEA